MQQGSGPSSQRLELSYPGKPLDQGHDHGLGREQEVNFHHSVIALQELLVAVAGQVELTQ